ncbi:MAG TPA: hypothetical protein IGQ44_06065 [Geminocystis sp. M7585_C2015_104]|nr:hypothetical protein [Geminocystis sp. M7585_C2015_104]
MVMREMLFPCWHYGGVFTPENWLFNCNLQEFAQKVSMVEALHTAGKISTSQALERLNLLWEGLERGYYSLGMDGEENS